MCFPRISGITSLAAAILLLIAPVERLAGYALTGMSWPASSSIVMQLELGPTTVALQDGLGTWNASAADALALWNQQMVSVQFSSVNDSNATKASGDGYNSVFFADNVFGQGFGSEAVAVTVALSDSASSITREADVIFNSAIPYNSYRGPIQFISPQGYVYDLHRVALHEFGHVLGLDHPDAANQVVIAIMNSVVGDLDHLADDDIAGVRALYATQNFSLSTGSFFSFQVPAPSGATSFVGSGLPPGVSINPTSGLISGVPTTSGIYNSAITVAGPNGAIETLTFQFTIIGAPTQQGQLLAKLDIKVFRLAADPARPRIYATMPDDNSVAVIDSVSRTLIKTIFIGSHPQGLAVSADGSKLWVANSGSTTSAIGVVDLNTLQALPSLAAPNSAYAVVEGLDGRLYVSSASGFGFNTVMQIDSKTGITTTFGFIYQNALLAISPDRNTLFAADQGLSPSSMVKVDVSTATPLVSQTPPFNSFGSNGEDLKISHDGKLICFVNGAGNGFGGGYTTSEIPTDNLAAVNGVFNTGAYPSSIAWSNDDSRVYHDVASQGKIDIFDTRTFQLLGAIDIGSSSPYGASDLVVDNTDKQLFVAVTNGVFPIDSELRVYSTGQSSGGPVPPSIAQKSFANLSTRMRTQLGDNVLIGGFIINGHDPKTVVVRAIGPSVPLTGNLADPMLQLFDSTGAIVASNDNWGSNGGNIIPSGLVPKDQRESAVVATLQPGSYTAIVRGVGDITGVALVELYDISGVTDSKLANISTRGNVETGDNVMIGGFIIGGDQPTRVLIRAIGTSLAGAVPGGALQDPVLQLFDGTGSLIFQNDDWRSGQEQQIIATGLAPPNDRESAIVATLQPGSYTAIVRGKNDTTGVALVEVYNLETN